MANTYNYVICPAIGAAWAAYLAAWADAVQDDANTITYDLENQLGCKSLLLRVGNGGDYLYNRFVIADIPSDAVSVPITYVLGSPGWRAQPPVLNDTYGTVDTKTNWEDNVYLARNAFLAGLTGATLQAAPVTDDTYSTVAGAHYWIATYRYKVGLTAASDATTLMTREEGTTVVTWLNNMPPSDGLLAGPQSASVGGGGGVDVSPIVEALNDIATRDVTFALNNGAAMWSFSGRVRAE